MLLELEKVSFRYRGRREWSLRDISLRVEAGEFVTLAGTNGSGKSTLLRLLNGLIPHFYEGELQGRIRVAGLNPQEQPIHELFGRIALLSQNPQAQLFSATVRQELAFGLESLALPRPEIEARLAEVVNYFNLQSLLARKPDELSGGEQQRVLVAAMLALRPDVLALDEPFAMLDYAEICRLSRELDHLNQRGTTLLVADQRLGQATGLLKKGRRCLFLEGGRLVADGLAEQIFGMAGSAASDSELIPPLAALFKRSGCAERPLELNAAVEVCLKSDLALESWPVFRVAKAADVPLIELQAVTLQPGPAAPPALHEVSLKVDKAEVVALLGRNGSGKSTLARHMVGLKAQQSGKSWFNGKQSYRSQRFRWWGRNYSKKSALQPGLAGILVQNSDLQLFLPKVQEELEFGRQMLKRGEQNWLQELIERLEIGPLLERNPFTLSGGEKKRVALACVLATEPELVVLDEPTAGLDYRHARTVTDLVGRVAERGSTVVLISHDLELAANVAPRWLILDQKRLERYLLAENLQTQISMLEASGLEPPVSAYLADRLGQSYKGGPARLVERTSRPVTEMESPC
jgi:energy-coupling factor transport system ATP-binding protein